MNHIKDTKFPITGQLGVIRLDISDLYHLQVGDVIDLNKSARSQVKLYVCKQPWFMGTMGVHKKNIAVRI
jgi:flagellar motor switch protein FliM